MATRGNEGAHFKAGLGKQGRTLSLENATAAC